MHLISYEEGFRQAGSQVLVGSSGAVCSLSELKTTETSGWFSFGSADEPDPHFDNRFIVWRSLGQDLFLEERSFAEDIYNGCVCLNFSNEVILPGAAFFETSQYLLLLIATTSAVYRRVFSNPKHLNRTNRRSSIFSTSSVHEKHNAFTCLGTTNEPPHTAAVMVKENGESVFAIALEDGAISLITFSPVGLKMSTRQEMIRPNSRLMQIWSGLWTKTETVCETSPVSLCFYNQNGQTILCSVGFDQHVRLYSCEDRTVHAVVNLVDALDDVAPAHQPLSWATCYKWRVKAFTIQGHVFIMVYANFGAQAQFCILNSAVTHRKVVLELWVTFAAPDHRLVDFHLTERHVYTLWSTKQCLSVKYKALRLMDAIHQEGWLDAINVDCQIIENESKFDLPELVGKLFSSDIFTFSTVQKALKLCCSEGHFEEESGLADWESLRRQTFKYLVTRNVSSERDLTAVLHNHSKDAVLAKNREALTRFFNSLWKNCVQYHNIAMSPLGLMHLHSCNWVGVIMQDRIGSLTDLKSALGRLSISARLPRQNTSNTVRCCLNLIDKALRHNQDRFLWELITNRSESSHLHSSLAQINSMDHCDEDSMANVKKTIASSEKVLFDYLSEAVDSPIPPCPKGKSERGHQPPPLQTLTFDLWASCLKVIFEEKLAFYRALLQLLSIWSTMQSQSGLSPTIWCEISNNITPRVVKLCRCYAILRWISGWSIGERLICKIGKSVLSQCCRYIYEDPCLMERSMSWLGGLTREQVGKVGCVLPKLFNFALTSFWPEDGCVPVFDCLFAIREFQLIELLAHVLEPWCQPAQGLRRFYYGYASLQLGHHDQALEHFRQALQNVFQGDQGLIDKLQLHNVTDQKLATVYLTIVAKLFADVGDFAMSVQCCQDALGLADGQRDRSAMLQLLFKYQVQQGDYASALQSLLDDSNVEQSKESLNILLNVLLEKGNVHLIVHFSYDRLQTYFLGQMELKARATNPIDNLYYNVLFAYFTKRDDFQRAASYMYEQYLRLKVLNNVDYATLLKCRRDVLVAATAAVGLLPPADDVMDVWHNGDWQIVTSKEIEQETLLNAANYEYALKRADAQFQEPSELIEFLTTEGNFAMAEALCVSCEQNSLFTKLLTCVVQGEIVENQRVVNGDDEQEDGGKCGFTNVSWTLTQHYLKKYGERSVACDLYASVARCLLQCGFALPAWLYENFRDHDIYGLFKFFYDYGMHKQAVELVEYVSWRADAKERKLFQDDITVWLPSLLADNLAIVLEKGGEGQADLLKRLRSAVASYYHVSDGLFSKR